MAGVFSRSWHITKLSFRVIKQDKELLLFPILAGIFSIIFILAMLFPTLIVGILGAAGFTGFTFFHYVMIFLTYLGLAFIATFFNVCVVYTAKIRFSGKNATPGETFKFAFSKIHLIFMWSLLSATVGLLLTMLDKIAQRLGVVGEIILTIIRAILGVMWSIITIFVIPSMVFHDLGPIKAIKKSISVLRKTWGESLIRIIGLGAIQGLFILLGLIVFIPLIVLVSPLGIISVLVMIGLFVMYILGVILIFGVANQVFNTALYIYAETGKVVGGYDSKILGEAFKEKKKKGIMGRVH